MKENVQKKIKYSRGCDSNQGSVQKIKMKKDRRARVGPEELILGRFGSCNRVGFLGSYK